MNIITFIYRSLNEYQYKHNGEHPNKIFIPHALVPALASELLFCNIDNDEMEGEFMGIPTIIYTSNKPEYYLAEKGDFWA